MCSSANPSHFPSDSDNQVVDLQKENFDLRSKVEKLEKDYTALKQTCAHQRTEILKTKEELEKTKTEKNAVVGPSKSTFQQRFKRVEEKFQNSEQRKRDTSQMNIIKQTEIVELEKCLESKRQKIRELKSEIYNLQKELKEEKCSNQNANETIREKDEAIALLKSQLEYNNKHEVEYRMFIKTDNSSSIKELQLNTKLTEGSCKPDAVHPTGDQVNMSTLPPRHKPDTKKNSPNGATFYCTCQFACNSQLNLENHIKYATNEGMFDCPVCQRRYQTFGFWKNHIKTTHNRVKGLDIDRYTCGCRMCGQMFQHEALRKEHVCIESERNLGNEMNYNTMEVTVGSYGTSSTAKIKLSPYTSSTTSVMMMDVDKD